MSHTPAFDLSTTPLVELSDGVLTVPVSLAAAGNALDAGAVAQARAVIEALAEGSLEAGAVLLVGGGRNFCAGGNVAGFAAADDRAAHIRELADLLHGLMRALDRLEVPVVAAVTGWAAGAGLSLVLASDVAVGGPGTTLLAAYPGIGLTPDGGMSWRLPRVVGPVIARTFLLTNEPMDGRRAYQLGVLSRFEEDDAAVAGSARALAEKLAAGPREAMAGAKRLLRASGAADLDSQLDAERDSIAALAVSADGVEGVDAFVAKRPPRFGAGA